MTLTISRITLLVPDIDEAKSYYTQVMRFHLLEDTRVTPEKRWVVVSPSAMPNDVGFVLALANKPSQQERVGNQTGGKVLAVLHTDSLEEYAGHLATQGVTFVRGPEQAPWGKVLVFEDRYGNLWDAVER
jgi:predicted enzyme related to lactoylglutathione lyase